MVSDCEPERSSLNMVRREIGHHERQSQSHAVLQRAAMPRTVIRIFTSLSLSLELAQEEASCV